MDDANYLLTDEFLAFAEKIKTVHEEKKAKKAELKVFFDKIQNDLKALDIKAKELEDQFNAWKKAQSTKSKEE
jgi:uncharacterized lipoprotein NlpE involved in copper resistance